MFIACAMEGGTSAKGEVSVLIVADVIGRKTHLREGRAYRSKHACQRVHPRVVEVGNSCLRACF